MLCYKDITFCPFWEECKDGSKCKIALTDEIYEAGIKWSKEVVETDDVLICQLVNKPDCFKGRKYENTR